VMILAYQDPRGVNCSMGTTPVRLAIVGCGAIAEAMHIPAALNVNEVELTALIDADATRARDVGRRFQVSKTGTCLEDFATDLDAVILATPPHVRPQLATQAFELGLHVLCEKPLANSTAECDVIIDAGWRAARVLAVAHIFRFWPSRTAVRQLIKDGRLGRIGSVTVTQGNPYSWQGVTGYNMRHDMVPGGVLLDAGIHPLDTLLWWFGDPVSLQYEDDSLGGLESNIRLSMRFPDEIDVQFRQSRTCRLGNEFRIVAERGTLLLSNYNTWQYQWLQDGESVTHNCVAEAVDHSDCERRQLIDFTESVSQQRTPRVGGDQARRVVQLVERCYATRRTRALPSQAPLPGLTY